LTLQCPPASLNAIACYSRCGILDVTAKWVARAQNSLDKGSLDDVRALWTGMSVINREECINSRFAKRDESVANILSVVDKARTATGVLHNLSTVLSEAGWCV